MDLAWTPKNPSDFISDAEITVQSSAEFETKLNTSGMDAQLSYKIVTARQASDTSRRFKSTTYVFESKVWSNKSLLKDGYSRSQKSD